MNSVGEPAWWQLYIVDSCLMWNSKRGSSTTSSCLAKLTSDDSIGQAQPGDAAAGTTGPGSCRSLIKWYSLLHGVRIDGDFTIAAHRQPWSRSPSQQQVDAKLPEHELWGVTWLGTIGKGFPMLIKISSREAIIVAFCFCAAGFMSGCGRDRRCDLSSIWLVS